MKKLLSLFLVLSLVLVACSGGETNGAENANANVQNSANGAENMSEVSDDEEIVIGIVQYMDHISLDASRKGFVEELEASGKNVSFVDLNANGDASTISQIASKLAGDDIDLVYAIATPAAQGMQRQITDKPIVFAAVTDPVGAELVESMEAPGSNVTGVSDYIDPKSQLERFKELYPDAKTLGVIYNTGEQNSRVQVDGLKEAAGQLDLEIKEVGITQISDVSQAIASLAGDIDGLFALTDNMVASAGPTVAKELLDRQIPSVSAEEGQVKKGLLFSEGVNYKEHGKQAGRMALEILDGKDPSQMPAEYNEVNNLLINGDTAQALGLDLDHPALEGGSLVE